jgi:AraC-like DNA-binding protein
LWNATILHARWGGMVKERGLMAMAVFGNIVTSFSWFGVNMLGIGLHSYGWMDKAFPWLMAFDISQVVLIVLALLPSSRYWASFKGRRNEGPVCALLAQKNRSCGVCLAVVEKLSEAAAYVPRTIVCHVGLSESAVPIRLGDRLIGFLQTGQVFCKAPSEGQFQRVIKLLGKWEVELDRDALRKAYFGTRVWSVNQYKSVIELLSIFAQHLSILSSQLLVHRTSQAPVIAKAKAYIREHFAEKLSLNHVAKVANVSRFHFCKLFKTATGLRFTDYVSRVRTEKAMNLLLNPNLRIGEIAFEVGFQSITHFNRKFRDNFGQTPTRYRSRLRVSLC